MRKQLARDASEAACAARDLRQPHGQRAGALALRKLTFGVLTCRRTFCGEAVSAVEHAVRCCRPCNMVSAPFPGGESRGSRAQRGGTPAAALRGSDRCSAAASYLRADAHYVCAIHLRKSPAGTAQVTFIFINASNHFDSTGVAVDCHRRLSCSAGKKPAGSILTWCSCSGNGRTPRSSSSRDHSSRNANDCAVAL